MNSLHYSGDTGERVTSIYAVITSKMKNFLRRWISGQRSTKLGQLHLHIDEPTYIIKHNTAEQKWRDKARLKAREEASEEEISNGIRRSAIGFQDELVVHWSSLLGERTRKAKLASLHLFYAEVAAFQFLKEIKHPQACSAHFHGGKFALPATFDKSDLA